MIICGQMHCPRCVTPGVGYSVGVQWPLVPLMGLQGESSPMVQVVKGGTVQGSLQVPEQGLCGLQGMVGVHRFAGMQGPSSPMLQRVISVGVGEGVIEIGGVVVGSQRPIHFALGRQVL